MKLIWDHLTEDGNWIMQNYFFKVPKIEVDRAKAMWKVTWKRTGTQIDVETRSIKVK